MAIETLKGPQLKAEAEKTGRARWALNYRGIAFTPSAARVITACLESRLECEQQMAAHSDSKKPTL